MRRISDLAVKMESIKREMERRGKEIVEKDKLLSEAVEHA